MRDALESAKPGEFVTSALRAAGPIPVGARVEATDGPIGAVRERVAEGPEHAYLVVDTAEGLLYVPERLVEPG